MPKITEYEATADVQSALAGGSGEALIALGIKATAAPKRIVEAIDQFVFDWQDGKRPKAGTFDDAEDVPVALGSLWGDQLIRQFSWQWVMIAFGKNTDDLAPAVVSLDRSLVVYPIHYLTGALADPAIDVTVALSFNMLETGTIGKTKAKGYMNLMDGVHRIVPRRLPA